MESVKPSAVNPSKSKLARTFAKVLPLHVLAAGVAPDDAVQKIKSQGKVKDGQAANKTTKSVSQTFNKLDEELERRLAVEALVAKLFATISAVKAAYAQLQYAQSPYDADGIQAADKLVVSELKALSELKQCFVKKQYDPSPEHTILLAEIQEQRSLLKTFEIMGRKLESQLKLKESEVIFLKEKLEETNKQNKLLEKRLNQSGQLSVLEDLHITGLSPSHFITFLQYAVKSMHSFVRLMIDEMKSADWDTDAAAGSIEHGVVYWKADDKCFTFQSFVCREMFSDFHCPFFSLQSDSFLEKKNQRQVFFERFMELKSIKVKEYLTKKPRSTFAKFCRTRYLRLVHPKMEASFFGDLNVRNKVTSHEFPDSSFFASFAEMARRVWLLHCFAFAFEPEASIFQVTKGCRFSEVFMESVTDDAFLSTNIPVESEPRVAFTVVPGFRIGKTIIQCQVYLSHIHLKANH
ncbi:hypothetical protein SLA2020_294810 [Shorea laevis]